LCSFFHLSGARRGRALCFTGNDLRVKTRQGSGREKRRNGKQQAA